MAIRESTKQISLEPKHFPHTFFLSKTLPSYILNIMNPIHILSTTSEDIIVQFYAQKNPLSYSTRRGITFKFESADEILTRIMNVLVLFAE